MNEISGTYERQVKSAQNLVEKSERMTTL